MRLYPVSRPDVADGFAWTEYGRATLWWMDRDRVLRQTPLPTETQGGVWLDEDELYLFGPRRKGWSFRTDTASLAPMDWETVRKRFPAR